MITPVRPLRTKGSFILAWVSWQFIVRVKLFSKWKLYIGLEFKFNVLCKSIASKKTFNVQLIILKKYLLAEGSSSSSGWARVMRERTYSRECLLRKKMKAERIWLIPWKHTENLVLLTAYHQWYFVIQATCTMNTKGQTGKENIWTLTRPNVKSQS